MQGRLHEQTLTVTIQTECAHCGQSIEIDLDSDLICHRLTDGAAPLIFAPNVDFAKLKDPSIIDAF